MTLTGFIGLVEDERREQEVLRGVPGPKSQVKGVELGDLGRELDDHDGDQAKGSTGPHNAPLVVFVQASTHGQDRGIQPKTRLQGSGTASCERGSCERGNNASKRDASASSRGARCGLRSVLLRG
jgi:hypothetical protein